MQITLKSGHLRTSAVICSILWFHGILDCAYVPTPADDAARSTWRAIFGSSRIQFTPQQGEQITGDFGMLILRMVIFLVLFVLMAGVVPIPRCRYPCVGFWAVVDHSSTTIIGV